MKNYTEEDISFLCRAMDMDKDILLVHSSLYTLGILKGVDINKIPNRIIDILYNHTKQGSLIFPNFNYDFSITGECDLSKTPSQIGTISEVFRKKTTLRSGHPIFSFSGLGEKAEEVLKPDIPEYDPFGSDSVFGRLHKNDAIILLLGVNLNVCTYMVYCERQNNVVYRFYKPFHGSVKLTNGIKYEGDYYHYCFPKNQEIRINYAKAEKMLIDEKIINTLPIGMNKAYWFRTKAFINKISEYLDNDPWFLLHGKPKRIWGMVNGVEKVVKYLE